MVTFILLLTQIALCQDKVNRVTYGIELKKNKDNNQTHYVGLISNVESKLKQVTFDLNYNSSIAKFSMNLNSLSEEDTSVVLDIADMLGKVYYNRVHCDTIYSTNEKFKNFKDYICFSISRTEWMVSYEKKLINGFECTKAFGTLKKNYGDGENFQVCNVVAWFCPKIKTSFGPKSYGGLSGLIMQLELPLVTFKAISMDSGSIDLSIPTKNIISESDLFETLHRH